jgi:hypothetical protein
VYAVWPASFVFLVRHWLALRPTCVGTPVLARGPRPRAQRCGAQVLYSFATQRFTRARLFNIVICTFMLWFALFGVLYPSHESVHFHGLAEEVLLRLPAGLAGAVGMVRGRPLPRRPSVPARGREAGRVRRCATGCLRHSTSRRSCGATSC